MRRSTLGKLCLALSLGVAVIAATPGWALAQNAVIRGTVRSDNGEAVAGANAFITELNAQAATNEAGVFVVTIPGDRVRGQQLQVRVRAIGYRPASRPLTLTAGEQTLDFVLTADVNRLDEIVVTGVMEGTEKSKLPFAATTVDMADVPVLSVDPIRLLAGRVPGANITSQSGRPGQSASVILRGPTSIDASGRGQGPLYIVDGVIITGDLPDFNPADIENVELVKGAAAASLYGARAGNGVIQITTRSGRRSADGMSFNVRGETGASDVEHPFPMAQSTAMLMDETNSRFCTGTTTAHMLCGRTLDWNTEAARVNNQPGDFALSPAAFPLDPGAATTVTALSNAYLARRAPGRMYNPVEQFVSPQAFLSGTVDMTGRFNNTTVFASGSALDQGGAIRYLNGFQRYTGRLNADQRVGSQWTVSLRSFYSRSHQDGLDQEQGSGAFFDLTRQRSMANLLQLDTLGRLHIRTDLQGAGAQNENPLYTLQNVPDEAVIDRFLGGLTTRFSPASWVDLEANFSYDLQNYQEEFFRNKGFRTTAASTASTGRVFQAHNRTQGLNSSLNASFRRNFGRNIQSRFSLRYLYEQQDYYRETAAGNTLVSVDIPQLSNVTTGQAVSSSFETQRQIGYFAGAGFDIYNGRYGIDALVRRDGSSLFGSDNRWQTFGRASAYWNIALEPWWFAPSTISAFKLRGSYGTAGGRPRFSAQYETWNISSSGVSFGNLGNKALRPEVTTDVEIGADIELWRRALFTITYDKSRTENQMLQVPNPAERGFANQWLNAGTLSNSTLELSLNLPVVQRRTVNWTWTFTYDRTRTVVDSLAVPPFDFGPNQQGATTMFRAVQGERYATIYGRRFVTECSQLPAPFNTDCGGATSSYQVNDDGYIVWAGSGNSYREGITRNLYGTSNTVATAPWGVVNSFGMPIIIRADECATAPTASCAAKIQSLGTGLPDWQFAIGQNFQYQRLSVYALLQGVMGREVFNEGMHWAHLDYISGDVDQYGRSVETAKPIGYYWRAGFPDNVGIGGFYDILGPTNYTVETTSYAKLRELALSYSLGAVGGVGNWTVSLIGRNLFTITDYRGFDPEVGQAGGLASSAAINAVDAFAFPNTRTFTFALQTSF